MQAIMQNPVSLYAVAAVLMAIGNIAFMYFYTERD
jgi:hypothetical protein